MAPVAGYNKVHTIGHRGWLSVTLCHTDDMLSKRMKIATCE